MSFASRLETVTVFPLLSRPFRVSLRSLQCLNQCPQPSVRPPPPQCRALHLYKTASAKTALGMHKVLPYAVYKAPPPGKLRDHRINLHASSKKGPPTLIAEGITLAEVYDKHVKPGQMIWSMISLPELKGENIEKAKERRIHEEFKDFVMYKAGDQGGHVKVPRPKYMNEAKTIIAHRGELKQINLLAKAKEGYAPMMLDKAYRFIELGCPVEFSIKMANSKMNKKEKLIPGPQDWWPWLHEHFPHLHPDFVLKSMPAGTYYLIRPISDGRRVAFVLSLPLSQDHQKGRAPPKDMTGRLFKVQEAVAVRVQQGKQNGLPMAMRMGLIQKGNENYSLGSDMSKGFVESAGKDTHADRKWGEASKDEISETRVKNLGEVDFSYGPLDKPSRKSDRQRTHEDRTIWLSNDEEMHNKGKRKYSDRSEYRRAREIIEKATKDPFGRPVDDDELFRRANATARKKELRKEADDARGVRPPTSRSEVQTGGWDTARGRERQDGVQTRRHDRSDIRVKDFAKPNPSWMSQENSDGDGK